VRCWTIACADLLLGLPQTGAPEDAPIETGSGDTDFSLPD
jgi:hypothetical protein